MGDPMCGVDHINGNGLDNRRVNLRLATSLQNQGNSRKRRNASSYYKGVSWYKPLKKWRAQIKVDKHVIHLGYFVSEEEAAIVYQEAAIAHFGEFARYVPVKRSA